jgi:hypothetical protein
MVAGERTLSRIGLDKWGLFMEPRIAMAAALMGVLLLAATSFLATYLRKRHHHRNRMMGRGKSMRHEG